MKKKLVIFVLVFAIALSLTASNVFAAVPPGSVNHAHGTVNGYAETVTAHVPNNLTSELGGVVDNWTSIAYIYLLR